MPASSILWDGTSAQVSKSCNPSREPHQRVYLYPSVVGTGRPSTYVVGQILPAAVATHDANRAMADRGWGRARAPSRGADRPEHGTRGSPSRASRARGDDSVALSARNPRPGTTARLVRGCADLPHLQW